MLRDEIAREPRPTKTSAAYLPGLEPVRLPAQREGKPLPPVEPECRKNPSSLKLNHYCTAMVTGGLVWSAAVTTSGASGAGVIPGGTVAVT